MLCMKNQVIKRNKNKQYWESQQVVNFITRFTWIIYGKVYFQIENKQLIYYIKKIVITDIVYW